MAIVLSTCTRATDPFRLNPKLYTVRNDYRLVDRQADITVFGARHFDDRFTIGPLIETVAPFLARANVLARNATQVFPDQRRVR